MIMRERVPCNVPLRWLLIVGLLALIAVPAWSLGQPAPPVVPEPAPTGAKSEPVPPVPVSSQPASAGPTTPPAAPTPGETSNAPSTASWSENPLSPPALNQGPSTRLANPALSPAAGPPAERERRLSELENKLDVLLKEVRALRVGADSTAPMSTRAFATYGAGQQSILRPTSGVVTLIRATYKLPKEKAEALAALLRDHVKAHVMETKADGENLIVTTTPEAQRTVGEFIGLLQDKAKPPTPAARQGQ